MVTLPFCNRIDAARQLALALDRFRSARPVVLAISRDAVPMGKAIANRLGGEFDIALVTEIGAPGKPEVAIGSVDERGNMELYENCERFGVDVPYLQAEVDRQLAAMSELRVRYRMPPVSLQGRTTIVVDDGLATGSSMAAALNAARRQGAAQVVCAVPVAANDALRGIEILADVTVCLATPVPFRTLGHYYLDFSEVDDAQVAEALGAPRPGRGAHIAALAVHVRF